MALPERITFITGNAGKLAELQGLLSPHGVHVDQDARGYPEIQADTLAEVGDAGARHLLDQGVPPPFLLEDAGLTVAALRGFPGVYSRYALDTIGCTGILDLLRDVEREARSAAFIARLVYVDEAGSVHGFDGTCRGRIADRAAGDHGFGFDPIFIPEDGPGDRTFAEMTADEKSALSHRGRATAAFVSWLCNH